MAENAALNTATLESLQSTEQKELMNEIDKLRAYGVDEFVSLPQLVVCGDQSSGKSSVLEAITEIPFPRKDNLCTRFATQIVLRRSKPGSEEKVSVSIIPHNKRSEEERKRLAGFEKSLPDFNHLPDLIESAKDFMGIGEGNSFSRDTLSIEITGPNRPQLTVVDLPGLIHTANKGQSSDDVNIVSQLVDHYLKNERTIILPVIAANNDYSNQIIIERSKRFDSERKRTLGIITKPDLLDAGTSRQATFIALAKNEEIPLKLGWHVLRNTSERERGYTFAQRNQAEVDFFSQGAWENLPRKSVGIEKLRSRLSILLFNHIKQEIPRVYEDIRKALAECEKALGLMGQERRSTEEHRIFLFEVSERFGHICKAGVDGEYELPFFRDLDMTAVGFKRRFRAVIQSLNTGFAHNMRTRGHLKEVVDATGGRKTHSGSSSDLMPERVTRKDAIAWVKPVLQRGRGRELPGTYNPLLIGELFVMQAKRWDEIAEKHLRDVFKACAMFIKLVLREVAPSDIMEPLFGYHINLKLDERFTKAKNELKRLIEVRKGHAVTYNHYYTENVQQYRISRTSRRNEKALQSLYRTQNPSQDTVLAVLSSASQTEADMEDFTCEELLDCMLSFYKVAYKTFVDNVAILCIEEYVMKSLVDVFSPLAVMKMDPELLANIAQESEENQVRRAQLSAQQDSLQKGLAVCRKALRSIKSPGIAETSEINFEIVDYLNDASSDEDKEALSDGFLDNSMSRTGSPVAEPASPEEVYPEEVQDMSEWESPPVIDEPNGETIYEISPPPPISVTRQYHTSTTPAAPRRAASRWDTPEY